MLHISQQVVLANLSWVKPHSHCLISLGMSSFNCHISIIPVLIGWFYAIIHRLTKKWRRFHKRIQALGRLNETPFNYSIIEEVPHHFTISRWSWWDYETEESNSFSSLSTLCFGGVIMWWCFNYRPPKTYQFQTVAHLLRNEFQIVSTTPITIKGDILGNSQSVTKRYSWWAWAWLIAKTVGWDLGVNLACWWSDLSVFSCDGIRLWAWDLYHQKVYAFL